MSAKLHFKIDRGFGEGKGHSGNVPVAFLTGYFSHRDMTPMGKIDVVRQSMDLYPWNSLIVTYVTNQLCFFLARSHCFLMTILAEFNVWNRCFFAYPDPQMAVKTSQSCFFNVLLVIV